MKKNKNIPFIIGGALVAVVVVVGAISLGSGTGFQGYLAPSITKLSPTRTVNSATVVTNNITLSVPVVAYKNDSLNKSLANGTMPLYKWTVTAPSSKDIAIKQMDLYVKATGNVSLKDFKLMRNGVDISSSSSTVDIINGGGQNLEPGGSTMKTQAVLIQWNDDTKTGEEMIAAGSTMTYELQATATNVAKGDNVATYLYTDIESKKGSLTQDVSTAINVNNYGSNFIWSDLSQTPHKSTVGASSTDWNTGKNVSGLSIDYAVTTNTLSSL